MNKQTPDPRITKTKQSMCAAMLLLLERTSFVKITISDICNTAMVSRTTFYQHFQDKYELVKFSLEQAGRELQLKSNGNPTHTIEHILNYVMDNRRIFKNLLLNGSNEELVRIISDMSISNLKQGLKEKAGFTDNVPAEVAAVFLSGGIASLLHWWVRTDFLLPKEDLSACLYDMIGFRS